MIPIIIINWNGFSDTLECIDSVLKLGKTDFHIHLIDNGSDSSEGLRLSELYAEHEKVTVHCYKKNLQFTGAHLKIWNEVLSKDNSIDYIALLNNDTVVDPLWLDALMTIANEKQCAIVASKMIQYDDRTLMDNAGHKMLNTGEILPIGHGKNVSQYKEPFLNVGACAGAALYQTSMLRRIGFFDDHFTTGYEDAELGLRATVSGYASWYCPGAIVYHKGGQSIKKIFNMQYSTSIFSHILYSYFKNLKTSDLLLNLPSLIFKYSCMIMIDLLLFRVDYLMVMLKSISITARNYQLIKQKRIASTMPRSSILLQMTFFLWFDIKRLYKLLFTEDSTAIDQYR